VPEAPMHKNDFPPTGKDDIGGSGQRSQMQAITTAYTIQDSPNYHFGRGVYAPNGGHYLTSKGLCFG